MAVSEVIELSSGEEDALHIVDSSASVSEDDEEEEKGGTHVNDVLNQRDALGRVLVNLNHPPEEENVFLAPQLARAVKPHQVQQIGTLLRCRSASWLGHGLLVLYHEQLLAQASPSSWQLMLQDARCRGRDGPPLCLVMSKVRALFT